MLFFDQFEEFFLGPLRLDPERRRSFIHAVAECSRDPTSGIHFVFAMREDHLHRMDKFRNEIPAIFHSDSSLRLRWFDEEQARHAISKPAAARGARIEPALEDAIVADLVRDGEVEPAALQIVCDTLWRHRRHSGRITLGDYRRLGIGTGDNVAQRILRLRIEEEVRDLATRKELTGAALEAGHELEGLAVKRQTLEEVYLALTAEGDE